MSNEVVAADEIRLLVERYECLSEERKGISDDLKDVMAEAKSRGFCTKALRKIIAMRKMDENDRREAEAILATYMAALGMQHGFDF